MRACLMIAVVFKSRYAGSGNLRLHSLASGWSVQERTTDIGNAVRRMLIFSDKLALFKHRWRVPCITVS